MYILSSLYLFIVQENVISAFSNTSISFITMLLQRKIVKKSTTDKKCYAYAMPKAEPTPDEIKAGVLQVIWDWDRNTYSDIWKQLDD